MGAHRLSPEAVRATFPAGRVLHGRAGHADTPRAQHRRQLPLRWLGPAASARASVRPMRAPISLDLHITNFNYPDTPAERLFDRLVEIATTAEEAGFSSISVMDHLHQIPVVGPEEHWMLEGNVAL